MLVVNSQNNNNLKSYFYWDNLPGFDFEVQLYYLDFYSEISWLVLLILTLFTYIQFLVLYFMF